MSETDVKSPKNQKQGPERPSSAILSWSSVQDEHANTPDEEEIPRHLFLSPTPSESAPSTSSRSSQARKIRRKKLLEETSSVGNKQATSKVSALSKKENADSEAILSSASQSQEYSSSDSENLFSVRRQMGKSSETFARPRPRFKGNKVHDVIAQKDPGKSSESHPKLLEIPRRDERRSSAGGSSIDTDFKRSITSASEMSYKERIRDRFNAVKERAVESLSRPNSRIQSGFLKPGRPGIDEDLKQEEFELTEAMRRHEKIRSRWQRAFKASLEVAQGETNFFGDDESNASVEQAGGGSGSGGGGGDGDQASSPSAEDKNPEDDHGDSKILTSDLLGFKEEWEMVEFVKPEMSSPKNLKLWNEKLFYPSTKAVSLENKLEPGLSPRFVEKEGLYVRNKVNVSKSWKNKMEQRILMVPEGRKWFDRDGELASTGCPLKTISTRPYCDDDGAETTSSHELVWKPALPNDVTHRYMDLTGNVNYVLDVDISSIEFSHHPLFSREHVLAQRLRDLCVKHKRRREADALSRLNGRLTALRRARDNVRRLQEEGGGGGDADGDGTTLDNRLMEYINDIKEVRQMRYAEGLADKLLTEKIVATWKDLMKLREQQGYQCTVVKLSARKKVPESGEDDNRQRWESDLAQEIVEVTEETKAEYKRALEEYKINHEIWKRRKRQGGGHDEDEDAIERLSDDESDRVTDSDDEDLAGKEPKPPKTVDVSEVKDRVTERFEECFRGPDEPEMEFTLSADSVKDATTYNNKEELRRSAVKRCLVYVKLFYNGKEVCRSKSRPLGQKFNVKVGQRFALRILEWPESLMLEIHEETGSLSKNLLVPAIYLPLPDAFATVANSEVVRHEFSSDATVSYHHAAVGSGKEFTPCPGGSEYNNQPLRLYTTGTVACRVGWVDDNGKILAPTEKYWNNLRSELTTNLSELILSGGAFDVTKLREWAEKSKLDPNDPYNSAFFNFIESAGDGENGKPDYFRLNPGLREFEFCNDKDLETNARLKLLRLRDTGEPEFRDMKMIPLNEKQIHREIFKDYEKRMSIEFTLNNVQTTADPIGGHRTWGKKYLEQVQQMLLKQFRMSRQNKRYQDIITEESVPGIGTLGLTFMKWLQPKRPLRPVRKERKKIPPQNLLGQEVVIVVNVVRAFEVPVRKDLDGGTKPGTGSNGNGIEGFSLVNVRPFVEISFQGLTARTTAAEGANPTWNQDLRIPVVNKNGYFSSGNFQSIRDTLYLHLFDEIVIDLIEDDSERETNIHQRLERHWLGSMEIPFSTLYFNSRIEGTFKLYSPPILLGYEREAHRLHFSGSTGQEPLLPQRDATYITLFVTVQPALNPPKPIQEKMECSEAQALEKHLEGWQEEVSNLFPHRKFKALVLDITGKSVCVTRFLKALPLPPIAADDDSVTPQLVARFVAMIPLITESAISPGFFDIWLNGDQVLRLLSGDSEDHALLLCCYFLRLGLQAYVLLGSGIPHGFMAYVLVKETTGKTARHYVWDPTNGQRYNVDDSFCPLQKVYSVISDQNIWVNIQAEEAPRRTRFDLSKRSDWFPAFGKNISAPTGSVQPDFIEYRITSSQAVDFLQDKIEKKLRDSLMKWRRNTRTQWNRYCAATLRKLLPSLEQSSWNADRTPDHVLELQHILSSHKMCGFPINMAYTRIEAVTEAVKATGVHCNETEGVEFALAVYIHPYPNNVLSVWVYVASLVRRR